MEGSGRVVKVLPQHLPEELMTGMKTPQVTTANITAEIKNRHGLSLKHTACTNLLCQCATKKATNKYNHKHIALKK